jgi:cytidylate kinase
MRALRSAFGTRLAAAGPRRRLVMSFKTLAATLAASPPPSHLATRVIAVDGYSGAGKSLFATRLATEMGAEYINTDDLVPGWTGLGDSVALLAEWVLEPITAGEAARWHRYDWELLRYTEWVDLAPCDTLVVDGCGAGHRSLAPNLSWLVWVTAPAELRARRLPLRSDWEMYEPHVATWAAQERLLRASDDVAARADLVVDSGRTEAPSCPVSFDPEREFVYLDNGAWSAGSPRAAFSSNAR